MQLSPRLSLQEFGCNGAEEAIKAKSNASTRTGEGALAGTAAWKQNESNGARAAANNRERGKFADRGDLEVVCARSHRHGAAHLWTRVICSPKHLLSTDSRAENPERARPTLQLMQLCNLASGEVCRCSSGPAPSTDRPSDFSRWRLSRGVLLLMWCDPSSARQWTATQVTLLGPHALAHWEALQR